VIVFFPFCIANQQEVLHFKELSDAISAVSFIIKLHSATLLLFFYFSNISLQIKTEIKKLDSKRQD